MASAHPVQSAPNPRDTVTNFAEQSRNPDDYLYLLVDGQAECALDHPLSVPSLIKSLGASAVTRVLGSVRNVFERRPGKAKTGEEAEFTGCK